MKKTIPRLLASELEILEMLWRTGHVTIVEAQRSLRNSSSYTAVQTRLDRMVKKGIVRRSSDRPARYSSGVSKEEVASRDLDLLLEQVTSGRVVPLVTQLVRDRTLTQNEIDELKQLIEKAEEHTPSNRRGKL